MTEYDDSFAEKVGEALRTPPQFGKDFTDRVMAAIAAEAKAILPTTAAVTKRRPSLFTWLIAPRPFMVSPLGAAAFALLLLFFGVGALRSISSGNEGGAIRSATLPPTIKSERDTVRLVQFVFVAPEAKTVSIVGDFNDWDRNATRLSRDGTEGLWTTSIPLPHGRHQYAFIVDGKRWMVDPSAPMAVENSYGTPNSVVTVTADAL